MKKALFLACLLSIFTVSSFAQMPANDAAYAKVNPVEVNAAASNGRHANNRHAKKRYGNHHRRQIIRNSRK